MPTRRRPLIICMLAALLITMGSGLRAAPSAHAASTATYVFYEKFPANNPEQWNVQTLKDGSQTYLAGGSYHVVRPKPGTMRGWPLQVKVPTGFQFNARLQLLQGKDPYYGITFWDDLANDFVLFALTSDGKAGLFRHSKTGYTILIKWRTLPQIKKGVNAINSISINLDPASVARGRTMLVNGVPLGSPCNDPWYKALGPAPKPGQYGLHVGILAGAYSGGTQVAVLVASMYDGTALTPAKPCH